MALQSERRYLSKDDIVSGIMLEFSYTKKDSSIDTYTVMVIDIIESNKKKYLHALLLDNLSDFDIVKLSTELGKSFNFDPDSRDAPLTLLNSDAAYSR